MRGFRLLFPITLLLAASCALLARSYRPPHAPESEAAKIEFPWGWPKETVTLTGVWLRAVTMALDDFLPPEEAERPAEGELDQCLSRRENYDVKAWAWIPGASDGGVEGDGGSDGGPIPGTDAGDDHEVSQPGMPRAPSVIYVSVFLLPGHCELDGSPLMDVAATYAVDTVKWRILAVHH
jgi:hypothetical protein